MSDTGGAVKVNYRIVLLTEGPGPLDYTSQLLLSTPNEQDAIDYAEGGARAISPSVRNGNLRPGEKPPVLGDAATRRGPKGRSVYIKAIAEDSPFTHLRVNDVFPNAKDLSLAMNYTKYNAIANVLSRAKDAGEFEGTLGGVTFAYLDTIRD